MPHLSMMTTAINTMASMDMITAMAINIVTDVNMGTTTATNTTANQKINTVAKACSKVD